jgi:hypothetical protein
MDDRASRSWARRKEKYLDPTPPLSVPAKLYYPLLGCSLDLSINQASTILRLLSKKILDNLTLQYVNKYSCTTWESLCGFIDLYALFDMISCAELPEEQGVGDSLFCHTQFKKPSRNSAYAMCLTADFIFLCTSRPH